MALDIEKLKKAQAEVQARMARGGGPSMKFWRPKEGVNRLRVLPPWTETGIHAGAFWREVWQHWNVSEEGGPILCSKKTAGAEEQDCPVCELVDRLKGSKSDVKAQELAKTMRAKVAYLMSVIDLAEPTYSAKDVADWKKERPDSDCTFAAGDAKVQVYAATTTIYEAIANIVINNNLDITNLAEGHNIILTKTGNKDPMKTRYSCSPDLRPSAAPLPADYVLPDLAQVGRFKSYEDVSKLCQMDLLVHTWLPFQRRLATQQMTTTSQLR